MGDPEAPRRVTPRILTEPRRPARIRELPAAPWLAVGTVCVGAFMGQLDASIVTTALPFIRSNLHASIASVEWVVLIYVLVLAGTVAAVGKIADRIGRKLLYTYGFGIFVVGSAACAQAPSLGFLVAARLVQAAGAVMLQANSYALIRDVLPPARLGTGLGIQGAAQAVGLSVGPALGGILTGLGGWRLIFLVNIPFGLVGLALGWFLLPRSTHHDPQSRIDPYGTLLLAAIPAALLAALSFAAEAGTPAWTEPSLFAVTGCAPGRGDRPAAAGSRFHDRCGAHPRRRVRCGHHRGPAVVRDPLRLPGGRSLLPRERTPFRADGGRLRAHRAAFGAGHRRARSAVGFATGSGPGCRPGRAWPWWQPGWACSPRRQPERI